MNLEPVYCHNVLCLACHIELALLAVVLVGPATVFGMIFVFFFEALLQTFVMNSMLCETQQ